MTMRRERAFTLIELLVVVAIIAILALIVYTNFASAIVRSKVARSQADIRSVATALESYRADWNFALPPTVQIRPGTSIYIPPTHLSEVNYLTTPVNYLGGIDPNSPFSNFSGYYFYNWTVLAELNNKKAVTFYWNSIKNPEPALWMISTLGPNSVEYPYVQVPMEGGDVSGRALVFLDYNPTNGVFSTGIIQRHGL